MLTSLDTTDRLPTVDEIYQKFVQRARDLASSSDAGLRDDAKLFQKVAEHIAGAIRRHEGERFGRTPHTESPL